MPHIPGTPFHDEDQPKPDVEPYTKPDDYEERAAPLIQAIEAYLASGNLKKPPVVHFQRRVWSYKEVLTEIRSKTEIGREWVAIGGLVRTALESHRP